MTTEKASLINSYEMTTEKASFINFLWNDQQRRILYIWEGKVIWVISVCDIVS